MRPAGNGFPNNLNRLIEGNTVSLGAIPETKTHRLRRPIVFTSNQPWPDWFGPFLSDFDKAAIERRINSYVCAE